MLIKELKPGKALNKALLKVKPNRTEIERFKTNLIHLLDTTNENESEEFHKNLVSDFLKKTYYDPAYFINTKGRNDLVIHNGNTARSTVGVIIETKSPAKKSEMITTGKLNTKAFQEIVLYYLRERITHKNIEVKHLVITNIYEWFIFDATLFDRLFAQNKNLVKQFNDFESGRLADVTTDFFYKQIAEPFIADIQQEVEFAYFDLRNYQKPLRNKDKEDDKKLIALFKLLSPEHLLKLPFINDSNSLDKSFYTELLHIIGLSESKEGSKKLIGRNKEGERNSGAILEDAIIQLDSLDKINRLNKPSHFGDTKDERLFNVALELSITWINRILFLKLLEAQLISYHKDDTSYSFLNFNKIRNYDDLNSLFFQVLARRFDERNNDVKEAFKKVPYLNSSLFEPTDIEQDTIFISNLKDDKKIPVIASTVLKDDNGKKIKGSLTTLEYLFRFLEAYDFSGDGGEDIQEGNKALINASVLGLIFEKINGYKDGSYFTPGFITMYMCRETIRKAVVQKFSDYCLNSRSIGTSQDLQDFKIDRIEDIGDLIPKYISRKKANEIVNSLKICDPAVGSGHFLVSALNEMIAIKNDLKILEDKEGKSLHWYEVTVENDELAVTDQDGDLFQYHPGNKESQRVQETLFHEKETIIENCLFGVDINPNSVKICRLRLWIELLKNAYYKASPSPSKGGELETLPNIDINIKCGNSLVSRFAIDADLKQALKKSKWTIEGYKVAVATYRNAESKEEKREMEKLIADIKSNFRSEISLNDPKVKRLRKLSGDLFNLTNQAQLFEKSKREQDAWNKQVQKLTGETNKLEAEIEEIKNNKIYENAFEWRFEFPEVLNDDGDFMGFDVVIGNPPYMRQESLAFFKPYLSNNFEVFIGTGDILIYFFELGMKILKLKGKLTLITSNKFMRSNYGKTLRTYLVKYDLEKIIDFGELPVFDEAATFPAIYFLSKDENKNQVGFAQVETLNFNSLPKFLNNITVRLPESSFKGDKWNLTDNSTLQIMEKMIRGGVPLGDYVQNKIYRGLLTGYNEAFVIDEKKKNELMEEDPKSSEVIFPFALGDDIRKYEIRNKNRYIILTKIGISIDKYPAIFKHLSKYQDRLEKRWDKGNYWWELRSCSYYEEFEKPKILFPDIAKESRWAFSSEPLIIANTAYMVPVDDKYLLGIMNSKLIYFFYSKIAAVLGDAKRGGRLRWIFQDVKKIPIASPIDTNTLTDVVNKILTIKNRKTKEDTSDLENQIDQLVYQLYGLTEEEIAIVENGSK